MKIEFKILMLIIFSALIISCEDDPVKNNSVTAIEPAPKDTFKYPYKLGSFWYYGTKNFIFNVRPDSIKIYFPSDTISGIGSAIFERDTIINSDSLKVLRNSHSDAGHTHTTLELYKQSDTGLIRIAFYSIGTNFGPYRQADKIKFSYHDKSFVSLYEMLNYAKFERSSGDTTLFFDDPPLNVLKYPTAPSAEWSFVNFGSTRITKKYTGYEYVNVPAGRFYCIRIKRNVYYNSPEPDSNYFYYDYFSEKGMVKRDFALKNIPVNNFSGELIGYIDVKEEAFLNFFTLP